MLYVEQPPADVVAAAVRHDLSDATRVHTNLAVEDCECARRARPAWSGDVCASCGGETIQTGTCHTCTTCGTSGGCG